MKTGNENSNKSIPLKSFIMRFVVFAAGWMILIGGQKLGDIWFVFLFVAATTLVSIHTVPPRQWLLQPLGVVKFFPYFMLTAVRGGWDVARRVFFRIVPIDPDFITVEHDGNTQKTLILAWVISLLPGTASCVINEGTIVVHVLDKNLPVSEEIKELQNRINEMFAGGKH